MQYGFLIDHDRCIGCHACTVACKSENDVPIGNFRPWVKYTERGSYPDIRRHFAVLRCNHCSKAPCVTICPVNALEKRADGIVDIDRDACIGCRACMQACPYDAIYLNDDRGSVEKCHFCAHRVEKGLEPACAVVCPENAIISGDIHDPQSTISRLIAANDVSVRRGEQRTGPNVYYKGVLAEALQPGVAEEPATFIWSDRPKHRPEAWPAKVAADPNIRTVLDVEHRIEWGWAVALYLVTKGVAAGVAMLAPFAAAIGLKGRALAYMPEIVALIFIGITGFLLVEDLKKPLTFFRLFTRPNWNSWLVKGAWVINVFVAVIFATLLLRLFGLDIAADMLRWVGLVCGAGVAGYTAFLFAQCEGRDLWQSRLLLPHLLVQAVMCGCAAFLVFHPAVWSRGESVSVLLPLLFTASALAHAMFALSECRMHHETSNAQQAAAFLPHIRLAGLPCVTTSYVLLAIAIACAFLLPWVTFLPALCSLYLYEHAYIRAGQLPPLS
ncbi:MAG: 4Fe-4S dicluster domain-containing protein [Phycisphaerales bacterium]